MILQYNLVTVNFIYYNKLGIFKYASEVCICGCEIGVT